MMQLRMGVMVLALALAACGTDDGVEGESALPGATTSTGASTDSLTAEQERERRQRAVSESGLPGARGIGGALDAQDAAERRNAALDSLQ